VIRPEEISVVLLSYARPWNLPIIVESLLEYGFTDIHIVDNWTDDGLLRAVFTDYLWGKINLFNTSINSRTAGRTLPYEEFKNDVVATVDDDYAVTKAGWDRILAEWVGDKIVAQIPDWNRQYRQAYRVPFVNIGYGSLFRKEWPVQVYTMLFEQGRITQGDWLRFSDRIFTSFFGRWSVVEATDDTLIKLRNPSGENSETDESSIHLESDYWRDQWDLVTKIIVARGETRAMMLRGDPTLSEYQGQMGFLSHAAYFDSPLENGSS